MTIGLASMRMEGRWIEVAAPIEHSPLYVKAGSIIPFAVCQQFTGEQPDAPYTIKIYPGAVADFEIYEDAGDGYAYRRKPLPPIVSLE